MHTLLPKSIGLNLCLFFLFIASVQAKFTGFDREYGDGNYVYLGVASGLQANTLLLGFDGMYSGSIGRRFLLGANFTALGGETKNSYSYSADGRKFYYSSCSVGFNVGERLDIGKNYDFSIHLLFGPEMVFFSGGKEESCRCTLYKILASDNLWFVRPGLTYRYKDNFAVSGFYNFSFANTASGQQQLAFGNASDFDGPELVLMWNTTHHNRFCHYHEHHWCR